MKNRYEFRIEDIKEVKVVSKNDPFHYTVQFTRDYNNEPALLFKQTYHALPIEDDGRIRIMCESCGKRTRHKKKYYYSNNFTFKCGRCDGVPSLCDEGYVKSYVMDLMDKDKFNDYDIYINDVHII